MEVFLENLKQVENDANLQDFARKEILHGTPFVFLAERLISMNLGSELQHILK